MSDILERTEPDRAATGTPEIGRSYLHEEVYRQIVRLIERGEFPGGTRLPTEFELAARFGVSRPIVRRALEQLRERGYATTRKGSGTIVSTQVAGPRLAFPVLDSVADLQQFYEFRISLEGQIAAQAAERRAERDLAAMVEATDRADTALGQGNYQLCTDLNFAFHRAVAAASGNRFFLATLEALPNLIGETSLRRRFGPLALEETRQRRLLEEHRQILRAIEERDARRARALMTDHIAAAMKFVFEHTPLA